MPTSKVTSNILPLHVLAKAALSLNRAKDNVFHFLKLLGNGFEIRWYNDFSTKFPKEAGVKLHPAIHVTFMPLINPTEPDIIMLITMKLVTSQSEQTGHECTVFTNDQQLFKRATQTTLRIQGRGVGTFLPNSWWHAYFVFFGCI